MPRTPRPGRKRWRDGGLADDGSESRSWVLGAAPQHRGRARGWGLRNRAGVAPCVGACTTVQGACEAAWAVCTKVPGAAPQCRCALGAFGAAPRRGVRTAHGGLRHDRRVCTMLGAAPWCRALGTAPCWGLHHSARIPPGPEGRGRAGRSGLHHAVRCATARGSHRAWGAAPRHDNGGRTGSGRVSGGSPTAQGSRRALGLRHRAGIGAAPRCRDRAGHWGSIAAQGSRWALGAAPWCRDRAERRGKRHDAGVTPGSGGCATAQGSRWAADCRRWGAVPRHRGGAERWGCLRHGTQVAPDDGGCATAQGLGAGSCCPAQGSRRAMGAVPRRRGGAERWGAGSRQAFGLHHGAGAAASAGGCSRA